MALSIINNEHSWSMGHICLDHNYLSKYEIRLYFLCFRITLFNEDSIRPLFNYVNFSSSNSNNSKNSKENIESATHFSCLVSTQLHDMWDHSLTWCTTRITYPCLRTFFILCFQTFEDVVTCFRDSCSLLPPSHDQLLLRYIQNLLKLVSSHDIFLLDVNVVCVSGHCY